MNPQILPLSSARAQQIPTQPTQPWSPTHRDCQVFQWIKFEGHTQAWVAQALGINQSTVSRIVQRYECWIARGGPAASGGLSPSEQVRYQRWLTYQRNERLLASALRLASEMEQGRDTSESTITHHASEPSREIQVKTRHATLDRTAAAVRFLRLAHRINMDQLKLVDQSPLPDLNFLSPDEPDLPDEAPTEETPAAEITAAEPNPPAGDQSAETSTPTVHTAQPAPAAAVHNRTYVDPPVPYTSPDSENTCTATPRQQESPPPAYPECLPPPKSGVQCQAIGA